MKIENHIFEFRAWDTINLKWLNNIEVAAVLAAHQRGERALLYPLMQYTGIDDITGIKIFEGDIVKFTRNYGNYQIPSTYGTITDICEIIFDTECSRFALKYKSNIQKLRKHSGYKYEIIGNIYETANIKK